jgi:hypothetical protein
LPGGEVVDEDGRALPHGPLRVARHLRVGRDRALGQSADHCAREGEVLRFSSAQHAPSRTRTEEICFYLDAVAALLRGGLLDLRTSERRGGARVAAGRVGRVALARGHGAGGGVWWRYGGGSG